MLKIQFRCRLTQLVARKLCKLTRIVRQTCFASLECARLFRESSSESKKILYSLVSFDDEPSLRRKFNQNNVRS